jgi:Zn-dependent M16 (insulinase) family peptidase
MDDNYENQMPLADCLARVRPAGRYNYEVNGPAHYAFVTGLLSDFDNVWPSIRENMAEAKRLLLNTKAVISFTGSKSAYKKFKSRAKNLAALFDSTTAHQAVTYNFPDPAISVYPAPLSQTRAVIQAGDLRSAGGEYSGAFLVTASLLNYDYLWPRVRDTGGAYGVNVNIFNDGTVILRSYRDPNKEETLKAYMGIPDFLRKPVDAEEYAGVRAHVLANWEEQFQPYNLWDYGAKVALGLLNPDAMRQTRQEIIYSQPGDLIYDADIWNKVLSQDIVAVGGKID